MLNVKLKILSIDPAIDRITAPDNNRFRFDIEEFHRIGIEATTKNKRKMVVVVDLGNGVKV